MFQVATDPTVQVIRPRVFESSCTCMFIKKSALWIPARALDMLNPARCLVLCS